MANAETRVYDYSHPSGGSGDLYQGYPISDDVIAARGEDAARIVAHSDVIAYRIQKNLDEGTRFFLNPTGHRIDPERLPEPQEVMDVVGESRYANLANAVDAAIGRTGLSVVISSGPMIFK